MRPSVKILLIEAFIYLGWARLLKAIPFARAARTLGEQSEETPYRSSNRHEKTLKDVSKAVRIMSRYTLWESKCLVMAIAAMKMLERRNIESTLYLGTAKDDGRMIAHAWLRSGPFYVTGADGMEAFTVVGIFGKKLKRREK